MRIIIKTILLILIFKIQIFINNLKMSTQTKRKVLWTELDSEDEDT